MELDYLQDFLALSETLSCSEAAERRALSQSALSKHIKSLERSFGGELFHRTTRHIELSERGKVLLPLATQLLADYSKTEKTMERFNSRNSSRFTLGTIRNPQSFGIDKIFLAFERKFPQYSLNLMEGEFSELERSFRNGETNLFCTYVSPQQVGSGGDPNFRFVAVGHGQYGAVVRNDDPLAEAETVSVHDLYGRKFLFPSRGSPFYQILLERLDRPSPQDIVFEGGTSGCLDLVLAGAGVAFTHYELYNYYRRREELKFIPFSPPIGYEYGLGYRETPDLSAPERCFIQFLRDEFAPDTQKS